jgi:hypothetical protein
MIDIALIPYKKRVKKKPSVFRYTEDKTAFSKEKEEKKMKKIDNLS